MNFEIDCVLPSAEDLINHYGLHPDGKTQKVIDSSFMHYMKLKMPYDSETMINNTRNPEGGLITVETPYAHYMNEGILYVNPEHNSPGFPVYVNGILTGYQGYRGKRFPSDRKLEYHGGPGRGAHFVERTIDENLKDVLKEAQEAINDR